MKSSSITKVTNDGFMWLIVTDVASTMFKNGYKGLLYKLYEDDSEALIESEEDLNAHLTQCGQVGIEVGFINGDPDKSDGKITTIGQLKEAIKDYNDNDLVVVEIHEGTRHEDLYDFTIDKIDGIQLEDNSLVSEIRLCI